MDDEIRAFRIIKKRRVDVMLLDICLDEEDYNQEIKDEFRRMSRYCSYPDAYVREFLLTKKEFKLLKEVLEEYEGPKYEDNRNC